MLHIVPPAEAYRRVELDALVLGGDARQLTRLCIAEAVSALERALLWHERADTGRRNTAIGKAIGSVQALRLGVDRTHPLSGALLTMYGSAAARLTGAMIRFNEAVVTEVRADLRDLAEAFRTG